jgi:hypothetical protein
MSPLHKRPVVVLRKGYMAVTFYLLSDPIEFNTRLDMLFVG